MSAWRELEEENIVLLELSILTCFASYPASHQAGSNLCSLQPAHFITLYHQCIRSKKSCVEFISPPHLLPHLCLNLKLLNTVFSNGSTKLILSDHGITPPASQTRAWKLVWKMHTHCYRYFPNLFTYSSSQGDKPSRTFSCGAHLTEYASLKLSHCADTDSTPPKRFYFFFKPFLPFPAPRQPPE